MKPFYSPMLAVAFLAITFTQSANAATRAQCNGKNSLLPPVIDAYCSRGDIVVPSNYASNPFYNSAHTAHVQIQGSCSPAQWVPKRFCKSQFYQLCVSGDKYGGNSGKFGRNGCQNWIIDAVKNPNIKKKGKKSLGVKKPTIQQKLRGNKAGKAIAGIVGGLGVAGH